MGDEYLLSSSTLGRTVDAELERLRLLEHALDPLSTRNLEATGIGQSWRCLEIGVGGGSILRWLADRVGDSGHVTGIDIRTAYVEDLAADPRVTIVDGDASVVAFPDGLDLVHERLTVGFIPDESGVRSRAIAALRPGGWYVSETAGAPRKREPVDAAYPGAVRFEELLDKANHALADAGIANGFWGRTQPIVLTRAGLVDVTCEGFEPVFSGGSDLARLWRITLGTVFTFLVQQGTVEEHEAAWCLTMFDDPDFFTTGMTQYATRGRKPE